MKKQPVNILLILLSCLLFQCDKEEVTSRSYPRIKTLPVTDITPDGAVFNAEILFRGEFEVVNYGFVWGTNENPTKEISERVVYAENIQSERFSEKIRSTLRKNTSYFVRAFVETRDYIVYGENAGFVSLGSNGPTLIDFSPNSGHLRDVIRISGSNFGRIRSNVEVRFNNQPVEISEVTETGISVLVPASLSDEASTVTVSVSGNSSSFDEKFVLLKPAIGTIFPTGVTFGSVVEIEGANFDPRPYTISVVLKGTNGAAFPAEVIHVTENTIKFRVPGAVSSKQSEISVLMNNFEVTGSQKLTIQDPVVSSFSPLSGKTLSEITIAGENFSPVASNNRVWIDGYPAEIVHAGTNELIATLPDQSEHIYSGREVPVSVEVLSAGVQADDRFTLTDRWFRMEDLPFAPYAWKGVSVNDEGYVLFQGGLWKYNPVTCEWTELAAFPDPTRTSPGVFSTPGKIFVGAGSNSTNLNRRDFWEYDVAANVWTQKADFPGEPRTGLLAFSVGANGYIGAGLESKPYSCCSGYNDVWRYNTTTGEWSLVSAFPLSTAQYRGYRRMVTAQLGDEVYVGLGTSSTQGPTNNEMYKYRESSDEWIRIEDYPVHAESSHIDGVAFTVGNQAFFGSGRYTDALWSYDGSSWISQKPGSRAGRNGGFSFVINNIAYLGGGEGGNQFWLFDVSQPD